jgi:hypothetical protein
MEFRNVEGFEIVVGCFDFGAFDDGEANREEDVFDFLEDLADQVMRADRTNDARKGEIYSFARERGLFSAGLDGRTAGFDLRLDMCAQVIEGGADSALQVESDRFQPIIRDLREHAGFAAEPGIAKFLPGRFVMRASAIRVEASTKVSEERGEFLGPRDAEMDERDCRFVFAFGHRI